MNDSNLELPFEATDEALRMLSRLLSRKEWLGKSLVPVLCERHSVDQTSIEVNRFYGICGAQVEEVRFGSKKYILGKDEFYIDVDCLIRNNGMKMTVATIRSVGLMGKNECVFMFVKDE